MNIAQELSIVRDNIAEYGMTNITQLEYDAIYQQGRADATKELPTSLYCDGFNDGYPKGRADKYQEIVSEYMLLTEKQVAEIRADAIDECIKLVGGNTKTIVGIVFDNSIPIHDRALGRMAKNKLIEELVEQLEQLKEQK